MDRWFLFFSRQNFFESKRGPFLGSILSVALGTTTLFGPISAGRAAPDRCAFSGLAPIPVLVKKGHELKTAERAAECQRGDVALSGAGRSMEPLYRAGTALVVSPFRYGQLRKGMAVVYITSRGTYVAHLLVSKKSRGWIAAGVNNAMPDRDFVTAENLVGVVTQAYSSFASPVQASWTEPFSHRDASAGITIAALR